MEADKATAWRGIVHAHSAYSHDGAHDLATLVELLERHGLDFAVLTEHVEDLDPEDFARYVGDCRAHSRDGHLLIPGVEYTFEDTTGRLEILLLGEDAYIQTADLADVWDLKERKNLVAILPHPAKFNALPRNTVEKFDLIEVWNLRYDGGYFPPWRNMVLFNSAKTHRTVLALCGPDYHGPGDGLGLVTVVEAGRPLEAGALLAALKDGAFHSECGGLRLAADLDVPLGLRVRKSLWRLVRRSLYHAGRKVAHSCLAQQLFPATWKERVRKSIR